MAYVDGTKFITVAKLRELLANMHGELELECNRVGNLSIYAGPGAWVGFIDFNHECVELEQDRADNQTADDAADNQ